MLTRMNVFRNLQEIIAHVRALESFVDIIEKPASWEKREDIIKSGRSELRKAYVYAGRVWALSNTILKQLNEMQGRDEKIRKKTEEIHQTIGLKEKVERLITTQET